MASDTATLDIERVQAERRRIEGLRDADHAERIALGPEDQAPRDTGPIDVDPATRAHQIVEQVLATAQGLPVDVGVVRDDAAAATARRIVEEVLAAATTAPTTDEVVTETPDATTTPAAVEPEVRSDLVLLGLEQPVVLVPGPVFEPDEQPFAPDATTTGTLDRLVEQAVASIEVEAAESEVEDDGALAPQDLVQAIRGAAESASFTGTRWIVAGVVWALAFALIVPLALKGFVSSVDMTVDLWGDGGTAATQGQVEQPLPEIGG